MPSPAGLEESLREARVLYDIWAVLGQPRGRQKMVCPLPDHAHSSRPTPSFSVWVSRRDGVQRFQCLGNCGHQGDVIDLMGYLHVPGYRCHDPDHIREALGYLSGQPMSLPEPQRAAPRRTLLPADWKKHLPPRAEALAYARKRGLAPATLAHFGVGQYKHFIALPAFEHHLLTGIKFRNTWPAARLDERSFDGLRFWSAKGSVKALFNFDQVAWQAAPLLIVKGEIPAMLLWQHGFPACAPTGGEGADVSAYALPLSPAAKRVVVGDNDPHPGVRARMQAAARERAGVLRAELRFPPERYKDIDEWILAEPEAALAAMRAWLDLSAPKGGPWTTYTH